MEESLSKTGTECGFFSGQRIQDAIRAAICWNAVQMAASL
jgi:hypothetical protein